LIVTSLKAVFIGSIAGLISGLLFALSFSTDLVYASTFSRLLFDGLFLELARSLLSMCGQLIILIGTLIVLTIYREAFTKFEKVKAFNTEGLALSGKIPSTSTFAGNSSSLNNRP
jgi:hypothetical protein